jgi:hypothetical protein
VLSRQTTDEAMGMLVRSFPAVVSLELLKGSGYGVLTDEALRAVSSLPAITSLDLTLCVKVKDDGIRAVSSCTALTSLDLAHCYELTDEGIRTVSSCTALTSLNL